MYGENTRIIRAQLCVLLRHHRIQHRIGGPGVPTLPPTTTEAERRQLGLQIARYRHAVLIWALEAVRAVDPRPDIDPEEQRRRTPAANLRAKLEQTARETGPRPSIDELHLPQRYLLLSAWQQAALAASLGEHDFGTEITFSALTSPQIRAVLRDAATVTRALVVLDHRYANTPGWRPIPNPGRLEQAGEACIRLADNRGTDLTIDLRGHHPAARRDPKPPATTIGALLEPQRALLTDLSAIPDARSLRRIIASQLLVTRALTELPDRSDKALHDKWRKREQTYSLLQRRTRDLCGHAGAQGAGASAAYIAAARATALRPADATDAAALHLLDRTFDRLDDRISRIVAAGAQQHLYFQRIPLPEIDLESGRPIKSQASVYVPLHDVLDNDLVLFVRMVLRPEPSQRQISPTSRHSRNQLDASLTPKPVDESYERSLGM